MKGTVVSSWMESSRQLFGDKVVNEALGKYGLEASYIFSPLEDVPDNIARGMVDYIGSKTGKSKSEIWGIMGEENIKTFSQVYPGFFKQESAFHFLKSMNDVHAIVMRRFKGAVPPVLDLQVVSPTQAMFIYRSKRGMGDYLCGLLRGVAKYFKEDIKLEIVAQNEAEVHIRLTFEKEVSYTKKYIVNQFLSLGFIKSTALKSALLVGLFSLLPILGFMGLRWSSLLAVVMTTVSAFLANTLVNLPMKTIMAEIAELSNRRYTARLNMKTGDEYEALMSDLLELKGVVQKDFIEFNAAVDEMYTFNTSLSNISETMKGTSKDISVTLNHVSEATTIQANNTEHLVEVLNQSIGNIAQVSDESQSNKSHIEHAMSSIESSFDEVQGTADQINTVMKHFAEIRTSGNQLQAKARDITQIVSIVSGIASQINMLALNASIEASRAGDAGRGFAVVADEVRKLSVETNQAVERINGGLGSFVKDIDTLVDGIDKQYSVLDSGSSSLNRAVETSSESKNNLKEVSNLMLSTTQRLKEESARISGLFDPIQNMAALAEENSASTMEATHSVTEYMDEITELSRQIQVFNSLIQNFQSKIQEYKL